MKTKTHDRFLILTISFSGLSLLIQAFCIYLFYFMQEQTASPNLFPSSGSYFPLERFISILSKNFIINYNERCDIAQYRYLLLLSYFIMHTSTFEILGVKVPYKEHPISCT
ncbi:hypothetical protein BDB01DRAFT_772980 [Pilobolus umbonatus]|nr:hypothetical protein BDB01DRAFT_772980 [Pilobolus umbonatus]